MIKEPRGQLLLYTVAVQHHGDDVIDDRATAMIARRHLSLQTIIRATYIRATGFERSTTRPLEPDFGRSGSAARAHTGRPQIT